MHVRVRRPRRRRGGIFLLVALLLAGLSGCSKHGKAAPQGGSTIPPSQVKLKRNVELTRLHEEPLTTYVDTVGYLEPDAQTQLAAGISGIVDEVHIQEGDWVTPSSLLIKIDQRKYIAALDVARANEKAAEARSRARELERISRSTGIGGSPEDKVDKTLMTVVAEAELGSFRAARELAEHNLSRSRVRAPYEGQINQRMVTPGMFVEDKSVIATMSDLRKLRLVGWIPEKAEPTARMLIIQDLAQRRGRQLGNWLASTASPWTGLAGTIIETAGLTASSFELDFTLRPFPQKQFKARVFYMSSDAQRDTHMFECKAEIIGAVRTERLRPGFTAKIKVPLRSASALLCPEESVRSTERGTVVFRPRQRTGRDGQPSWEAEEVVVTLGYRKPGWVEVLEGVKPGDWIVRKGAESLEQGTPIQFSEAELRRLQEN